MGWGFDVWLYQAATRGFYLPPCLNKVEIRQVVRLLGPDKPFSDGTPGFGPGLPLISPFWMLLRFE